ncbi:hypothetical protein [Mucilaginibacter lappiensis]|uniref:Uncharacterized protein n=1 Tax=Mucilaginibacter lappiensis TaxID=354630 RepID=A0A841JBS4_9SPHI|nr:hypothetical protein [Mucilaginibacter lappiensis]MBB6128573.1 hypothetical protein [Mucilaginibacter lappiensis]
MKYLLFFTICLWIEAGFAQSKLPVIKATSKGVSINDGGYLDKKFMDTFAKDQTGCFYRRKIQKSQVGDLLYRYRLHQGKSKTGNQV